MARSLSNVKIFSSAVVEGFSAAIKTRGFSAAAPQGAAKTGAAARSAMAAVAKKAGEEAGESRVAWIPDPKTGFYRPESHAEEIDVAELRAMLLKHKK